MDSIPSVPRVYYLCCTPIVLPTVYHGAKLVIEEEMDGEAIADAFSTQSGPDCLKDVIPKFGQRIKVYKAIKAAMGAALLQEV